MGFQILDKNKKAVPINEIDRIASEFWNVDYDNKLYASPVRMTYAQYVESYGEQFNENGINITKFRYKGSQTMNNWFDTIGFNIHKLGQLETITWNHVIAGMLDTFDVELEKLNTPSYKVDAKYSLNITEAADYYKPYFELIQKLRKDGYIPNYHL